MCTRNIQGEQTIIEHIRGTEVKHTFLVEENGQLNGLFVVDNATCELDIQCVGKNSKAKVTCLFMSKNGEQVKANIHGNLQADHAEAELYLLSFLGDKADIQVDG